MANPEIVPGLSHDDLMSLAMEDLPIRREFGDDDKPLGITAIEFGEKADISTKTAGNYLKRKEKDGIFTSRIEIYDGRQCRVYYKSVNKD